LELEPLALASQNRRRSNPDASAPRLAVPGRRRRGRPLHLHAPRTRSRQSRERTRGARPDGFV